VESELGKGSRFHFTAHFGLQTDSVRKVIPRDPMILRDMRVLIVDDNETNRLSALASHVSNFQSIRYRLVSKVM
jgi:hypothetical protein